jgi:hypothetical protein
MDAGAGSNLHGHSLAADCDGIGRSADVRVLGRRVARRRRMSGNCKEDRTFDNPQSEMHSKWGAMRRDGRCGRVIAWIVRVNDASKGKSGAIVCAPHGGFARLLTAARLRTSFARN